MQKGWIILDSSAAPGSAKEKEERLQGCLMTDIRLITFQRVRCLNSYVAENSVSRQFFLEKENRRLKRFDASSNIFLRYSAKLMICFHFISRKTLANVPLLFL